MTSPNIFMFLDIDLVKLTLDRWNNIVFHFHGHVLGKHRQKQPFLKNISIPIRWFPDLPNRKSIPDFVKKDKLTSFSFSSSISRRAAMQFRVSMNAFRWACSIRLCMKMPTMLTHIKTTTLAANCKNFFLLFTSPDNASISKCLYVITWEWQTKHWSGYELNLPASSWLS